MMTSTALELLHKFERDGEWLLKKWATEMGYRDVKPLRRAIQELRTANKITEDRPPELVHE